MHMTKFSQLLRRQSITLIFNRVCVNDCIDKNNAYVMYYRRSAQYQSGTVDVR